MDEGAISGQQPKKAGNWGKTNGEAAAGESRSGGSDGSDSDARGARGARHIYCTYNARVLHV